MGFHPTLKWNDSRNFECLGYSNWTICSSLSPFCPKRFSTFSLSYWEANSYYPRGLILGNGESSNSRNEWEWQLWVTGAFKLDHLQPIKTILCKNFSNFSTLILGGQFLLPQRTNNGKGNSLNSKSEWDSGFSVPWAFKLDHLQSLEHILFQKILNFFTFILGGQFLLPQGANMKKREFTQL